VLCDWCNKRTDGVMQRCLDCGVYLCWRCPGSIVPGDRHFPVDKAKLKWYVFPPGPCLDGWSPLDRCGLSIF
jgi:hypothetical protein